MMGMSVQSILQSLIASEVIFVCEETNLSQDVVPVGFCSRQLRMPDIGLACSEQHHAVLLQHRAGGSQVISLDWILELILALGSLGHQLGGRSTEPVGDINRESCVLAVSFSKETLLTCSFRPSALPVKRQT